MDMTANDQLVVLRRVSPNADHDLINKRLRQLHTITKKHPLLVNVLEDHLVDGQWIVTEYIEGEGSIASMCVPNANSHDVILSVALQTLQALQYLHSHGIHFHGKFQPMSVFVVSKRVNPNDNDAQPIHVKVNIPFDVVQVTCGDQKTTPREASSPDSMDLVSWATIIAHLATGIDSQESSSAPYEYDELCDACLPKNVVDLLFQCFDPHNYQQSTTTNELVRVLEEIVSFQQPPATCNNRNTNNIVEGRTTFDQHNQQHNISENNNRQDTVVEDEPSTDDHRISSLHTAAAGGDLQLLQALIKGGADPNSKDDEDMTPLHYAALNGHVHVVRFLIQAGAEVTSCSNNQITPLHLAATGGHIEVAVELIKAGANLISVDGEGMTPLDFAASTGNGKLADVMIQATFFHSNHFLSSNDFRSTKSRAINSPGVASVDVSGRAQQEPTPLHIFAITGHLPEVVALVQASADINALDDFRYTPLHLAAAGGHAKVVHALIKAGADFSFQTLEGDTPLHLATLNNHLPAVTALVQAGANISALDKHDNTPLHVAAAKGHAKVVDALIKAGADFSCQNSHGATPLHLDCRWTSGCSNRPCSSRC